MRYTLFHQKPGPLMFPLMSCASLSLDCVSDQLTPACCSGPSDAHAMWTTLAPLERIYPGFGSWYFGKVIPGLTAGKRHILRSGPATAPNGVAILKRDTDETKICTLWVAESQRHTGLGRELMEEAIEWCDTSLPLFTVPAEQYDAFKPLLRRFGFNERARIRSLYRPGIVEHIFNGLIRPTLHS